MENTQLKNQNFLIIGSNGGIGSAFAETLFNAGANIYGTYRNQKPTDRFWNQDRLFRLDLHDELVNIQNSFSKIIEESNPTTVIIASGSAYYGAFADMSLDDIHHTYLVDLLAPVAIAQISKRFFEKKGKGHIHIVSAIAGLLPAVKNMSIYTSAKFGLVGFARALAMECVGTNVKVSVSCPAGVNTGLPDNSLGDKAGFLKIIEVLSKNFENPKEVVEGIIQAWESRDVVVLPTEKAKSLAKK